MASAGTAGSDLAAGVLAGDRTTIGRAITLVESTLPAHRADAAELLDVLLAHSGDAHRVGVTGVPGVGKSTFIEALGLQRGALLNQLEEAGAGRARRAAGGGR